MANLIDEFKPGRFVIIEGTGSEHVPAGQRDGAFMPLQGRVKTINGITCAWLPYAPGKISWEELAGRAVLSGKFTGCWMVVYNWYGMTRVGHIGTTEAGSPETIKVHRAWDEFRRDHPAWALRAFKPFAKDRDRIPAPTGKDVAAYPTWFGLVTPQQECYSIVTYPQQGNPNKYRIVERRLHREALNPAGPHPMR